MDYNLAALLRKQGFQYKRNWGQNFLFDDGVLNSIVESAELDPMEFVVEIGAGAGTLTNVLAQRGARVLAIEIDPRLIAVLEEVFSELDQIKVIRGNVLNMDIDETAEATGWQTPYIIIANLPYSISTPLLTQLFEKANKWNIGVITIQKEVAAKLVAKPGDEYYCPLTLWREIFGEAELLFDIPASVFVPEPAVSSVVVRLARRKLAQDVNLPLLKMVISTAFGQRRKTITNALRGLAPLSNNCDEVLKLAGIDPRQRGETVALEEYIALTNEIAKHLVRK